MTTNEIIEALSDAAKAQLSEAKKNGSEAATFATEAWVSSRVARASRLSRAQIEADARNLKADLEHFVSSGLIAPYVHHECELLAKRLAWKAAK